MAEGRAERQGRRDGGTDEREEGGGDIFYSPHNMPISPRAPPPSSPSGSSDLAPQSKTYSFPMLGFRASSNSSSMTYSFPMSTSSLSS